MSTQGRQLEELSEDEALRHLESVSMGRIVFTVGGLPTVRPVNHVVDAGDIVIRTHVGSATLASDGSVVAYEADEIDLASRTGWSVIVTGVAHIVEDPREIERYEDMVQPWVDQPMTEVIRIKVDLVNGFELVKN